LNDADQERFEISENIFIDHWHLNVCTTVGLTG
jgi:hypothetical protein